MKKAILFFIVLLSSVSVFSQTLTVDPTITAATLIASSAEDGKYSAIKNNQDAINVAQTATIAAVDAVNNIQNKIYNGLMQVSSVVKNAYQVKEATQAVSDILSYESDMLSEAKQNPLALGFAVNVQEELADKAALYFADISGIILQANKSDLLMDAGERDGLLYKVNLDLQTLKALAAYSYFKVHLAVMQGIINTLNPFKGYIDLDGKIVNNLLSNWKH